MTTHGEFWYQRKLEVQDTDSFECSISEVGLPPKMQRKEAARYYNIKLFKHWMTYLDKKLKTDRKKAIISALMLGHAEAYKKYEELKDE